jgi:mono/diheme cytochrome c family protein
MVKHPSGGVKLVGDQTITPPKPRQNGPFNAAELSKDQKEILARGELVFAELCSQCHGNDGMGKSAGNNKLLAPALAGSFRIQSHPEYAVRVLLHGLDGVVDGKNYAGGMMQPMKEQSDQWIADVVSYIRNGLSNDASFVTAQQVAAIREKTAKQTSMYKYEALMKVVPQEFPADAAWKFTASNTVSTRVGGNASPRSATNYEGWSTGITQAKDMWYQIEFPQSINLSEFHFTSNTTFKRPPKPMPGVAPTMIATYPRVMHLETSLDGLTWNTHVANWKGKEGDNMVSFDQVKTKYVRLKLAEGLTKEADEIPWSMRQVKIYGIK